MSAWPVHLLTALFVSGSLALLVAPTFCDLQRWSILPTRRRPVRVG